jgi:uncharacterized repeat protein (TIGR01451 family)
MGVTKTASPTPVQPGGTITWTIKVTNHSADETSSGWAITDPEPTNSGALSEPAGGDPYGSCGVSGTGGEICTGGSLAPGASDTITLQSTATTTEDTTIANTVTLSANETNSCGPTQQAGAPAGCVTQATATTATPGYGLTLSKSVIDTTTKSVPPTDANEGDTLTYTVKADNTGSIAYSAAHPATFTDNFAATTGDAGSPGTFTATDGTVTPPTGTATTFTWTSPDLKVGQTATITYVQIIKNPDTAGPHAMTNSVSGDADSNCATAAQIKAAPCSVTEDINASVPELTIAKTDSVSSDPGVSDAAANPGDTVTYTVRLINGGQVAYTAANFTDNLSDVLGNATFVAGSATASSGTVVPPAGAGTTLTWTGPIGLPPAADSTVTVTW